MKSDLENGQREECKAWGTVLFIEFNPIIPAFAVIGFPEMSSVFSIRIFHHYYC